MNCDYLYTKSGSFISLSHITDWNVKKIKDGYYAIVAYSEKNGEYVLSEGWASMEAAMRCIQEFISVMCNRINGSPGVFNVSLPADYCPRSYAQDYINNSASEIDAPMNDVYETAKVEPFKFLAEEVNSNLGNIF